MTDPAAPCLGKKAFPTREAAAAHLRAWRAQVADGTLDQRIQGHPVPYRCPNCTQFHIGRERRYRNKRGGRRRGHR